MKKTTLALTVLLFISPLSLAAEQTTQANDNQNRSFYQSVKSGWNSFLDALAGKSSRAQAISNDSQTKAQNKPNTVTTRNNPPPSKSPSNGNNLYDSVRSGWNSFIDFLTGTKSPQN